MERFIGVGLAQDGLFAVPWIPLLLWSSVLGVAALWLRRRGRRASAGGPAENGDPPQEPWWRRRLSPPARLLLLVAWIVPLIGWQLTKSWDPLSAAAVAPGPAVTETRSDGTWQDDSIENAMSWSWSAGRPCLSECRGPRYVYRLKPGEPYSLDVTIRNDAPFPVTLLGRRNPESEPYGWGLAWSSDPATSSADPTTLEPFRPIELAPRGTTLVTMVMLAPECANPDADVEVPDKGAYGYPFVYEVLGWRRVGYVWPHAAMTVAGCH
jgi:hypothetical protein